MCSSCSVYRGWGNILFLSCSFQSLQSHFSFTRFPPSEEQPVIYLNHDRRTSTSTFLFGFFFKIIIFLPSYQCVSIASPNGYHCCDLFFFLQILKHACKDHMFFSGRAPLRPFTTGRKQTSTGFC